MKTPTQPALSGVSASKVSAIVAMSRNRVIGRGNQLPWSLPEDLKRFRSITMGHPVLMGRKTFESIGRVLPGRQNLVISRQPGFNVPGASVFKSLDEAINHCRPHEEIFIIGGAQIYSQALSQVHRIYLTLVEKVVEGDAFFPEWDSSFKEVSREVPRESGGSSIPYSFIILERM